MARFLDLADVGRLDEAITMREVTRTLEMRDELWDAPLLFAIIVLSLTVEWVLRKLYRNGLKSFLISGVSPIGFILGVFTVPAAIDLPTLDTLRDEQRSLRAELARLRRRLHRQLILELATDAVLVLTATAAVLVFRDWLFRFGVPVRLVFLTLALVGALAFLGARAIRRWRASRLDELTLALALDRHRPGVGQQITDVLQLPDLLAEPGASSSPAMVRLAVQPATCAALARFRLAVAMEPEADRPARGGLLLRRAGAGHLRPGCPPRGAVEFRALASGFLRAMAPADVPDRDGPRYARPARGPAPRTVPDGGADRPADARSQRRPLEDRRPR